MTEHTAETVEAAEATRFATEEAADATRLLTEAAGIAAGATTPEEAHQISRRAVDICHAAESAADWATRADEHGATTDTAREAAGTAARAGTAAATLAHLVWNTVATRLDTPTPPSTEEHTWSPAALRALAAKVIHHKGIRAGDDADHYHLANVARWDFPHLPEPTDAELEAARELVGRTVLLIDGHVVT